MSDRRCIPLDDDDSPRPERMTIWHFTRTVFGGAGQYAVRLSNALRMEGLESTVVVAQGQCSPSTIRLQRRDSPIRRLVSRGLRSVSHRISLGPFHSLRGQELYDAPITIRPGDIVHLHGMTGWIGLSGLRRLIPKGARVFWTAHDMWMLSGGCVVYGGCNQFRDRCAHCPVLRAPLKSMAKYELRLKKRFVEEYNISPIANSQWTAKRISESRLFCHVTDVPVIPPMVDEAYFAEQIPDLRAELDIPAGRNVISLGARSLDDRFKGIPEFLKHLAQVPDLADNVTVLLFGPGTIPIPPNLDVRLLGTIASPSELARVYRTSDVFVSPSQMETFGMTIAEAQAVGAPVAALDVGGVHDAVYPDSRCHLRPPDAADGLPELVWEMLHDKEVRVRNGAVRKWAQAQFGARELARQQLRIYAEA